MWSCTRACAAEALCCSPMALWELLLLTFSLRCWLTSSASLAEEGPAGPLDWLLSDKGPFHHSQEYTEFVERNRQGFSTRYKIYRLVVIELRLASFSCKAGLPWFLMVPFVVYTLFWVRRSAGHDPVTLHSSCI